MPDRERGRRAGPAGHRRTGHPPAFRMGQPKAYVTAAKPTAQQRNSRVPTLRHLYPSAGLAAAVSRDLASGSTAGCAPLVPDGRQ